MARKVRKQPSRQRSVPMSRTSGGPRIPSMNPPSCLNMQLRFMFDRVDFKDYCLHETTREQHRLILKQLAHLEQETLEQARCNGDIGEYPMPDLKKKNSRAYAKLCHDFDDMEALCKVVVHKHGKERIFGYREGNVIHIIWFDSKHEIWPEGKHC